FRYRRQRLAFRPRFRAEDHVIHPSAFHGKSVFRPWSQLARHVYVDHVVQHHFSSESRPHRSGSVAPWRLEYRPARRPLQLCYALRVSSTRRAKRSLSSGPKAKLVARGSDPTRNWAITMSKSHLPSKRISGPFLGLLA